MNFAKRTGHYLIRIFAALLSILFLSIIMLYARLAVGPINLDLIQPLLQRHINQQHIGFDLDLKKPMLKWQGWQSPIEVTASNVAIHNLSDQVVSIIIPELSLTFRLRSLLQGKFIPSSLIFNQPKVLINKFEMDEACDQKTATSPQDCLKFVLPLIDPGNNSRALKNIHFNQANVTVQDHDGRQLWSLSNTNFALERHSDYLLMSTSLNYDQHSRIELTAQFSDDTHYWQGSLKFINVNPAILCQEIRGIENFEYINSIIEKLPIIDTYLTGQINGTFASLKEIIKADVMMESGSGQFKENAAASNVYLLDHLLLKGQFVDQKFNIDALELRSHDGQLQVSGHIKFDPTFNQCVIDTQLSLEQFNINNLAKYWPEDLVKEARSWVIDNIHPASIPKAMLHLVCQYTFDQSDLKIIDLKSTINLDDATIHYMDDMSPVTNIQAAIAIDLQKINVAVNGGKILQDLNIKQAVIVIDGLDKAEQHISISNVIIDGPVECIVDILNAKPLKLLQKYNILSENTKGHVHTVFNMNFPLAQKTTFDNIKFDVNSTVENLTAVNKLNDVPVTLSGGRAKIFVSDQYMTIDADAHLNNNATHVYWKKFFVLGQDINSHIMLTAQLSPVGLAKIYPASSHFFKGPVDLIIAYDVKDDQSGLIKVNADLSHAELNIAGWKKLSEKPCHATVIVALKDNKPTKLQLLQLDSGTDLNIKAAGTFDLDGKLPQQLKISTCKIGATNIVAQFQHVKGNRYKMHIDGDKIDLAPYMDFITAPSKDSSKVNKLDINFDLILNIKEIVIDHEKKFYNNDIKVNWLNDKLNILSYVGLLQKDGQKRLYINLAPHNNGRRMVLKCADAGALFRSFKVFENIHKGDLKLAANHDDSKGKNSPWNGKLVIENFKLGQVPFLGRLFSLAVPTSFGDLFSNGKMSFDILKIKFRLNSDKLVIDSGRAHGPSLGITINGTMDQQLYNLNMRGSILPAYFINTLIAKIPLLGQLISGGKYEGIFGVSYKIVGTRNKPDIVVNPLSVLTPGLFRQLFSSDDQKVEFDEDSDTDTDESNDQDN